MEGAQSKQHKKLRMFLGVERKSLPNTKELPLAESVILKGSTSVDIKKSRRQFDLDLFSNVMSKPKQPCAKHSPKADMSTSNLQASESVFADMSDRHKSDYTLKKHNSKSLRQLYHVLDPLKDKANNSQSRSKIMHSDISQVFEKEEIPIDLVDEEPAKKKQKKISEANRPNRIINLDYLENPLEMNPTRKKDPVIKFSDIYKLLGHSRPMSNTKSQPSATIRKRSTLAQSRKSIFLGLNLPSNTRLAERRHQAPKLTSVVEMIRNNPFHLLSRVNKCLMSYNNIEEWKLTLEGQKPQFSNLLSNRLGGQFSKAQLDLISGFYFDEKNLVKPTAQLSAAHMLRVLYRQRQDEILMDAEKKSLAYLLESMENDPVGLELLVALNYSKHFEHDDLQLELFPQATNIFLRLLTEAKATFYGHLSDRCSLKLKQCINRTKEIKYLEKQKDLKTFSIIRAGLDDDSVFLSAVKKGLGFDGFKGRGIERGGEMGERITEEDKEFNKSIKGMVNHLRNLLE